MTAPRLTRVGSPPPVRIVHIGAGAFHRTHQAWFTARAADADEWGIASFTVRSDAVVAQLAPQGGAFTLVERGPVADRFESIASIAEVHPGADVARLAALVCSPAVAIVTMTVTEAGYHLRPDGTLDDLDERVHADVEALRRRDPVRLRTPLGRLLWALAARDRAGAGPISVVPCDNLPRNGDLVRDSLQALAERSGLAEALASVAFVSTSVDRITPHTTPADHAAVLAATGFRDEACVVAEPFADWTMAGSFPAGRPEWVGAGARLVTDIAPFEQRKLLLLNGGHIVLALEGLAQGHRTIADAMADAACRDALDAFWSEALPVVDAAADGAGYVEALAERFGNPRIEHLLAQIAVDTVTKIRLRIAPVLAAQRARGGSSDGSLAVLDTWRTCVDRGLVRASSADLEEVQRLRTVPGSAFDSFEV